MAQPGKEIIEQDIKFGIERQLVSILSELHIGNLTIDKAKRKVMKATGINKSDICFLDRLPEECVIFKATKMKKCEGFCGHYR